VTPLSDEHSEATSVVGGIEKIKGIIKYLMILGLLICLSNISLCP